MSSEYHWRIVMTLGGRAVWQVYTHDGSMDGRVVADCETAADKDTIIADHQLAELVRENIKLLEDAMKLLPLTWARRGAFRSFIDAITAKKES